MPLVPHLRPLFLDRDASPGVEDEKLFITANAETFEIEDFTAASEWEKFNAKIESIIHETGQIVEQKRKEIQEQEDDDQHPTQGHKWHRESRRVFFHDFEFLVERNTCLKTANSSKLEDASMATEDSLNVPDVLKEMMKSDNEFPFRGHPVMYFYGFNDFIVLSACGKEGIDTLTKIKMVLGTVTVASSNLNGGAPPILVQIMDRRCAQFCGVYNGPDVRTNLEMAIYNRQSCNNLAGLISLFREKLSKPYPADLLNCRVSLRETFELSDWTDSCWSQTPPDLDLFVMFGNKLGEINDMSKLPFGTLKDPVRMLKLYCNWSNIAEDMVIENNIHSDFDPLEAPLWSVSVTFDDMPSPILGDYLGKVLAFTHHQETMQQVLGKFLAKKEELEDTTDRVPAALNKLTGPSFGLTDIIRAGRSSSSSSPLAGPIKHQHLQKILAFLFPDSEDNPEFPYPKEFHAKCETSRPGESIGIELSSVKSAPIDGLVWRLAVVFQHCLVLLGGIKPVAHLLHEVFLEFRYRWENSHFIPGVPRGNPDFAFSLFHQKIQLLNCCIQRKRQREGKDDDTAMEVDAKKKEEQENSETDEDEFFDCDEDEGSKSQEWIRKPEGRKSRLGKLRLLKQNDWLYVPVCQEAAPLTEDQLAEQAEALLQLGEDAAGSEMRTKLQMASLYSDMESFKAANPGAVLGDFVRWYSPRDWIEDEANGQGKLSTRMEIPGNAWQEAWDNAKPVPARRQKRLFDDTRDAERILEYFTNLCPGEITDLLLPTVLHTATRRVMEESTINIPHVEELIKDTIPKLSHLSKLSCRPEMPYLGGKLDDQHEKMFSKRQNLAQEIAKRLQTSECKISQSLSLRAKFLKDAQTVKDNCFPSDSNEDVHKHMEAFVKDLYDMKEVKVIGGSRGPAGQLICKLFKDVCQEDSKTFFPEPATKEYLLKCWARRPYPYSRETPQRLYCCMKKGEFRLAGAFSIDKLFL